MQDNIFIIITALGGLGLFLLGMIIMTEGLRELAGDAIRAALMRFTHTPFSGALTGTTCTAILQSSSATTVATVGFVAAGLMSFTSALGIIFGANLGTTVTGWMVALIGFKLKIGLLATPMVLVGAILRLFSSGKLRSAGFALAGFGLIFVGISVMQEGMSNLQGIITPETLPSDTAIGRIQIVLLGMLATIITQSSSAGVATTMTALYAGAISFEQGLALIIGMDVGTTVTAILATIGTTTSARRTGVSHVAYNLLTATVALLLMSPYIATVNLIWPGALQNNAEISLVAFHSLFNIISIILILPFAGQFAHLLIKLVPDKQPHYPFPREKALLDTPALALAEVQNSAIAAFQVLLHHIQAILTQNQQGQRADLAELQQALDATHIYLDEIHVNSAVKADYAQLLELVHVLDHLQRLHERCEEDEDRAITTAGKEELIAMHNILLQTIQECIDAVKRQNWAALVKNSKTAYGQISAQRGLRRDAVARLIANGSMDVPEASDDLEAIRWLFRVSYHIARISFRLERAYMALATRA